MTLTNKIEAATIATQDENNMPFFVSEEFSQMDADLFSTKKRVVNSRYKKFPFVYFNPDYEEEEITPGKEWGNDIEVWIIGETNPNYRGKDRREKELPELITISDKLLDQLRYQRIKFVNAKRKYLLYKRIETNETDTPVNLIRLRLPGAIYCLI